VPPKQSRGLSLLEILIAVAILLTGFLFLLGAFPYSYQGIGRARNLQFASNLAQTNLENFVEWYSTAPTSSYSFLYVHQNPSCLSSGTCTQPPSTGTQSINAIVNGAPVAEKFLWQVVAYPDCYTGTVTTNGACPSPPQPFNDYNVVHLVSWVQWRELQGSYFSSPNGTNLPAGYGSHFLSVETWVYLP
jgi:type II secretory pathway pseudopilin PulG